MPVSVSILIPLQKKECKSERGKQIQVCANVWT